MTQEIELKLVLSESDAKRLGRLEAVRTRLQGRARGRRLVSTYFDTPDQRLRNAGLAMRIRRVGRTRLLCVKGDQHSLGGVLVRREWEGRVLSDIPSIADIGDADLRLAVEKVAGPDLQAVFTTTMARTSRDLDLDNGATAVMDVDIGEVTSGDRSDPVCELELELKTGDATELFDVAAAISREVTVTISSDTKAARGFRLLDGQLPEPVKATSLALDPQATVEWSLARIVQGCIDQVVANAGPVLANEDPEGVHQMRVGLRRLRSAFTLFKPVIPDSQRIKLVDEIRWLTNELGRSRDADVQAEEVIGPVAARMQDDPDFDRLLAMVASERSSGRVAARAAVASSRFTRLVLDVSSWMARCEWRDQPVSEESALLFRPVTELACRLLAQRHKKVVKRAKQYAELPIDEKHELRKDVKKLRYACEFFRALYPGRRLRAYVKRLSALQDQLGYLNDVAVAEEYVAHLIELAQRTQGIDVGRVCGIVMGWHQHALAAAEPEIARRVDDFLGARPFWG